uniref:Ig-like domain-containing protein n=1 Tax=Anabas testudineus TaxID=64144 RepID=A0A7N6F7G1_ANATE
MFSFNSDALAPVVSVQLGEPVTFTCVLPQSVITRREVYWYRQSAGDTLKLMVTLRSSNKEYSKEFSESRFKVDDNKDFISLTILSTTYEDEGMYHCEISDWATTPEWTGTYLLLKAEDFPHCSTSLSLWTPPTSPFSPSAHSNHCDFVFVFLHVFVVSVTPALVSLFIPASSPSLNCDSTN